MRSYEVSLRAVAFRYLWCVIRSCSPRISGAHECRNEGQSQPKRTFVTSRQYVKWSTCTCVDRNRLLLTDHTSKLMFLSFYSLNIKGYFQSLAYDVLKPKLKVFSLCYLRKKRPKCENLTRTLKYLPCTYQYLPMMSFEFELYDISFRSQIS